MASCDDDFSILGDESNPTHHSHLPHAPASHQLHQPYAPPHRFATRTTPVHAPPAQPIRSDKVNAGEDQAEAGDDYDDASAAAFCSNPFESGTDQNDVVAGASEKRKEHSDELSDGGGGGSGSAPYSYKRSKPSSAAAIGEYRKDREEWSDSAISCLLDAYTDKFTQLNRGNLRGRDWEEVAAIVSERCDRQRKSVDQCKNKVDNLKKRYKLERQRMNNGGVSASHWPWFKKMENIVGNSLPGKAVSDEDKGVSSPGTTPRQSKRFGIKCNGHNKSVSQMNKVKSAPSIKWRRVVFKISGAALAGTAPNNVDSKLAMLIAREVALACHNGVEVAIVVGGRNFFCGDAWVTATGLDRSTAYQIGMMATVMNSVLLQSALEKMGVQTRVQTAFSMQEVAEPYSRQRAIRHLEKGRVVIFAGIGAGTGNPLFSRHSSSTSSFGDSCRGSTQGDVVTRGATSMDSMALTFCEENRIPVVVFNLLEPGNISKALCGEQVGTLIDQAGRIS
ncbi:uncharacterized protein Pyn_18722 [Prunus yedoensis var. nudiflora]|uniref:UMP kinase n=1 Tax=Prunus yedoensis var. nudiflora TaxID=2094558 RepID=A0A314V3V9_PRUYE|nr:uncharacterized protein Pyn_18722 [Prunus yedoensis var. nudiflora]